MKNIFVNPFLKLIIFFSVFFVFNLVGFSTVHADEFLLAFPIEDSFCERADEGGLGEGYWKKFILEDATGQRYDFIHRNYPYNASEGENLNIYIDPLECNWEQGLTFKVLIDTANLPLNLTLTLVGEDTTGNEFTVSDQSNNYELTFLNAGSDDYDVWWGGGTTEEPPDDPIEFYQSGTGPEPGEQPTSRPAPTVVEGRCSELGESDPKYLENYFTCTMVRGRSGRTVSPGVSETYCNTSDGYYEDPKCLGGDLGEDTVCVPCITGESGSGEYQADCSATGTCGGGLECRDIGGNLICVHRFRSQGEGERCTVGAQECAYTRYSPYTCEASDIGGAVGALGTCVTRSRTDIGDDEEASGAIGFYKSAELEEEQVFLEISKGSSMSRYEVTTCEEINACARGELAEYAVDPAEPGKYKIRVFRSGSTDAEDEDEIEIGEGEQRMIIVHLEDGKLSLSDIEAGYLGISLSNEGLEGCAISTGYDLTCANCIARKANGDPFTSIEEVVASFQTGDAAYTNNVYTALGCWDTTYEGTLTRVLQIGLGISGALILVRMGQALTKIMSADNPEKKKEGIDMIVSAFMALLMLLFGAIGLRFLGINVLKVLPPGTIEIE
ncbi:hypothetical protein GF362_04415 [Candidatus Dojkabacteria bacterium]|nr:hypothetical protein [Candidatus Dojkabacteria bacterium]